MRIALLGACALLVGCSNNSNSADFGAKVVAEQIVSAQSICSEQGSPSLVDCKSSANQEARRAAKSAESMQETFLQYCPEELGLTKCEAMLNAAYEKSRP